jgi:Fuc2NAc and GlcNAc transferase
VTTPIVLIAAAALVVSWALTGRVRRYAIRTAMLDQPGPRSSHQVATPTGGGLAVALVTLSGIAAAGAAGWVPFRVAVALVGGGLPVALVGWVDDRRGTPAVARLAVQLMAGAWAIWWLGVPPSLRIDWAPPLFSALGALIGIIGVVWATNCFNFMDGIDGLAGGEAVTVGLGGSLLLLATGHRELATVPLVIAAASAGFLVWNWAPARIFLGDVGSGLLGFLFAGLAIASDAAGALPLLDWLLLLGVFAFDATATLLRRAWRGERWYHAHRSHAYQRAVQGRWSHAQVSLTVFAINAGLALLVWASANYPRLRLPLVLAAAVSLGAIYWGVQRTWASNSASGHRLA